MIQSIVRKTISLFPALRHDRLKRACSHVGTPSNEMADSPVRDSYRLSLSNWCAQNPYHPYHKIGNLFEIGLTLKAHHRLHLVFLKVSLVNVLHCLYLSEPARHKPGLDCTRLGCYCDPYLSPVISQKWPTLSLTFSRTMPPTAQRI